MSARVVLALGLLAVATLGAGAGATIDPPPPASVSALATAIRIVVPGTNGAGTPTVVAPPSVAGVTTGAYAYPDGVPAVTVASTTAAATADANGKASATGSVTGLVLFGGEITADAVLAQASAAADTSGADGNFDGTTTQNLVVLGAPPAGSQVALADWGTLTMGFQDVEQSTSKGLESYSGWVAALDITLTADHGGLPAGTRIQVGYAEVGAEQAPPPPPPTETATQPEPTPTPKQTPTPTPKPTQTPTAVETPTVTEPATTAAEPSKPEPVPTVPVAPRVIEPPSGLFPIPPLLTPTLEGGPYVFPVFGAVSYIDTYGEFRGDVSYHHGDDIFGELGQPIVAVADGTTFSVGWNKIGGNRLWLRDREGNAFYYAHLAAFSTLVFNGAHVRAGQVVGFMGNTGDADTTPTHLHFEVHPVSLLYLGYDGAVDPTPYLDEWRRLRHLPYPVPPGWAPSVTGGNAAPQPGAILLEVSDISSADGLDPPSFQRAIEASQARP